MSEKCGELRADGFFVCRKPKGHSDHHVYELADIDAAVNEWWEKRFGHLRPVFKAELAAQVQAFKTQRKG